MPTAMVSPPLLSLCDDAAREEDQAAMDDLLVRWRRMSADLPARIELGGNGVKAIKQQEAHAASGLYEVSELQPEPELEPPKRKVTTGKRGKKGKQKGPPKPPPPSALDLAKAKTRKQLQGVATGEARKVGPFVMASAGAHARLDVPGQSRLLQRRQMATTSAVLKTRQGWGGYGKALQRSMGQQSKNVREELYAVKTGPLMKSSNRRLGPESASTTPAIVLRNEVARRQRLRARSLAAGARASTLQPSESSVKPRVSIGPR